MTLAGRITKHLAGAYDAGSASAKARHRRWQWLQREFPDIGEMKVLDVGGDARSWLIGGVRPAHLTLLNLVEPDAPEPWMDGIAADACAVPHVSGYDLAFSNSVIEHVGGHWRRRRFAELVRSAAPSYWVQTPYRHFPVEPHFLVPGLQYMPPAAQARVVRRWPVGSSAGVRSHGSAVKRTMAIELLDLAQMRAYFPDARLERERLGPLTKSLVAIRR